MRRNRNTKILATLGPASNTKNKIKALVDGGADVFRLNFSHGTHDDHAKQVNTIRKVQKDIRRPIGILQDLQGPKLRIGKFKDGKIKLKAGETFRLDMDKAPGDESRVQLPHKEIFGVVQPGDRLLLNDGKVWLEVTDAGKNHIDTRVYIGGKLSDSKGVNLPGVELPLSALSDKDREDLAFGLDCGVDWVALSFVQRPEDVVEAKQIIGDRAAVMVKIEKPQAITRLDKILDICDGVMIARGDLGVEMPPEQVPGLQKKIIISCRQKGLPVVVATQMLDSMVKNPAPTRAEASDVATAVFDGADAVMLSEETAAGNYPVESVDMMNRIIGSVEHDPLYLTRLAAEHAIPEPTGADAITAAAHQIANTLSAAAIVTYTTSGSTALRAARERPEVPILCLTPSEATARKLAIVWGIHAVWCEDATDADDMVAKARTMAMADGFSSETGTLVITAGMPFGTPGSTNLLRIA